MDQKPIVYFCAAVSGDSSLRSTVVRPLIEFIRDDLQIPVLSEHIAYDNHREILAKKIGKQFAELNASDIEKQDIAWLDTATHVIAEISGVSTGVGREIEYARTKGWLGRTPAWVLCIYNDSLGHNVSAMIKGMNKRYANICVADYMDMGDAQNIIKFFLSWETFEINP